MDIHIAQAINELTLRVRNRMPYNLNMQNRSQFVNLLPTLRPVVHSQCDIRAYALVQDLPRDRADCVWHRIK